MLSPEFLVPHRGGTGFRSTFATETLTGPFQLSRKRLVASGTATLPPVPARALLTRTSGMIRYFHPARATRAEGSEEGRRSIPAESGRISCLVLGRPKRRLSPRIQGRSLALSMRTVQHKRANMTLRIALETQDPGIRAVLEEIQTKYNTTQERVDGAMSENAWCLATSEAIALLKQLTSKYPYSVVLSREDTYPGFWNSSRASEFLEHLKDPSNIRICQTRVKVFSSDFDTNKPLLGEEATLSREQEQIHGTRGGFYYVESKHLDHPEFEHLRKARFGLTVFQNCRWPEVDPCFVAVAFPALTLYNIANAWQNPLDMLVEAGSYDPSSDMQMVVIFNEKLVHEIAVELTQLIQRYSARWSVRSSPQSQ